MAPYNLAYAVIGASLLWVGWFGFNAGSAVGAERPRRHGDGGDADRHRGGGARAGCSPSGSPRANPPCWAAISGAVAGLVAITPASGFVLPGPAIIIGIAAGVICFWSATSLKHMLGYDDSLDVFGVHGIGGIVGALLTGVFAYGPLSATAAHPDGVNIGGLAQFEMQCIAVGATLVYSGVMTLILSDGHQSAGRPACGRGRGARGPRPRAARRAGVLTIASPEAPGLLGRLPCRLSTISIKEQWSGDCRCNLACRGRHRPGCWRLAGICLDGKPCRPLNRRNRRPQADASSAAAEPTSMVQLDQARRADSRPAPPSTRCSPAERPELRPTVTDKANQVLLNQILLTAQRCPIPRPQTMISASRSRCCTAPTRAITSSWAS